MYENIIIIITKCVHLLVYFVTVVNIDVNDVQYMLQRLI